MEDLTNMDSSSVPEENAYDQSISSTPETTGTPETPSSDEGFSGFYSFGDISPERAVIGQDIERFSGYVKNVTDLENRYENAAVNQGVFGALGNGLYRGVFGEIIGGTIQGFGALGNLMVNGEYSERNWLEDLGNSIMEGANEDAQIFERNAGRTFAVGDAAWWAKNTPSMLSTLSMLIPGRAAAGLGSKVGRAVAKGASKVTKNAARAERIVAKGELFGDVAAGSVAMRHAENMREAHGSFEEARQEMLKTAKPLQDFKGTDAWKAFVRDNKRKPQNKFELADYVGGSAAKKTYQINSGNLAMDIIQMYGFAKALRGTRGALKGTAKAKATGVEVSRYDRMVEGLQRTAKFAGTDMAGEGLEEMVNYVGTEEGLYYAKGLYTDREETTFQQRLGDYTNDDHFWESGFLGALGGGVFTGARAAAGYRATSKNQEELIKRAEERGVKMAKLGEIEKLKKEGAPAEVVNNMRRRFAYDLGIEAAMSGQAEVAEMQLSMLEEQMRADGATEAEVAEARAEAEGQMKLAEQAVAEANVAMKNHGLQGTEAAVFRKQVADNVFARQEIADIRADLAKETKGVKNADAMTQSVERNMLAEHRKAVEAKGDKATAADQIMLEILEERVAAHPEREGVMEPEALAAAKEERKALMDKGAGARSEEENVKLKELDEAIKADSEARTEPKLNDNVALDTQLGVQDEFLESMRSQMTTAEGLEGIRSAAAKIDEAAAKKEDKDFKEWLNKTTDQEELKAALKKEDNEGRKAQIQSKLTDLENTVKNDGAQMEQERSKDIAVPKHVQENVDELLANKIGLKLDETGEYYVDNDGNKYQRTTTFMNGGQKTEIPSQWGIPSSNIGNSVDEYTRDFFAGELRGTEAYPALPAELQSALRAQLADLEARFVANGERVIAKDVILHKTMETTDENTVGVAGTVDLLTVDANGDFRIYDMKTIRRAAAAGKVGTTVNEKGETVLEYGKKGKDLENKHQKQLSAYRMMLMSQLGVKVPELGIIAIDVNYKSPAGKTNEFYQGITADEAGLMGVIPHEPLSELLGMTEPVPTEDTADDIVDEPNPDTIPDEPSDESPTADVVLPEGTVSLPLDALVPYFAQRLQVVSEPSRGLPFLVHGHDGAVQIGDSAQANAYALLMDAITGKSNLPVTFEVTGTQAPGMTDVYKSKRARKSAGQELLENGSYRGGKGDSLVISVKVGGVTVGTLPTTVEIMEAAHMRGQANLRVADRTFGKDSRIGSARQHENLLMSEISQDAHLANALAMHNLRDAIYEASKTDDVSSTGRVGYKLNVSLSTGTTSFGQQAMGSLIVDTSMELTPENTGTDTSIRKHGIGLQLPSSKEGLQQIELNGDNGVTVSPYQQSETREGGVHKDSIAQWNSGALFIPLEHNGEVLWVKAPGLTINQLNSADQLIPALIQMLETGNEDQIGEAQNILGSNAVRKGKDGTWGIYPTNQTKKKGDEPISVLRGGKWSTDLAEVVPGMRFDIAVNTAGSTPSAFKSGNDMVIGNTQYASIQDFVAREIKLGYAPVTNPDGEVMGWTHPLAPAYPFNDQENGNGKKFSNENTKSTQLTVQAEVVPNQVEAPSKVSGKAALDALMKEEAEKAGDVDLSWLPSEDFDPGAFLLDTSRAASSNNTEKNSKEDMDVAEEWWAQNMPNVPFKRVKGIIKRNGRLGYGIFEKGAVQVSDLAVQGTEYHEAFHAVMHMFLDDTRRDKVLAEAAKRFGTAKDSVETEERLAEEFREYMLTKGLSNREKNVVRRFFSELMELINALSNGGFAAMRIYQGMNRGEFKSTDAKTKEYATRNKLIMDSIPEYDLNVQNELAQNLKTAAFTGLRAVQQGKGTPSMKDAYAELQRVAGLSAKDISDETAGATRAEVNTRLMMKLAMGVMSHQAANVMKYAPAEQKAELGGRFKQLFTTNREAVLDYYSNRPEMQSFTVGLMDQEFTAGANMDQQYAESFEKMNPKDSLSGTVRSLIETTPMMPIDLYANNQQVKVLMAQAELALQEGNNEQATRAIAAIQDLVGTTATKTYFGMPQMMNVDKVFPFMSEHLASLATPAAMFQKLYDMGDVYPEFKLLAIRLQKEDAATQAQFFAAMRKGSTAELALTRGQVKVRDVFTGALYNHNRQSMEVIMRDMAAQRGVTLGEMANGVAVGVSKIDHMSMNEEQFIKKAMQVLEAIGFSTMDAPAMERLITLRAGDHQFHENLFTAVQAAAAGFRGVANATEGQEERAEKTLNKNLDFLVRMFAPYDMGAVSTTFTNVEGKRIYSKQIPSYITEFFDQFEMNGRTMEEIEKDLREGMFRDPRMFATTYGQILFPQGIEGSISNRGIHQMKAFRVGGVDGMGGVTYTNMSEAQWYELQIAAITNKTFVNGSGMHYLPITTPSDAGNSYMVPAIVYDTATTFGETQAKNHLRKAIAAEFTELQVRNGRFAIAKVDDFMRTKLVKDSQAAFYQVQETTLPDAILDEAVDIAYEALMQEGKGMAKLESFQTATASILSEEQDALVIAQNLAVAGYLSNFSTSVAMAGTANEFKRKTGGNTTDMQKRHKHIMSPGLAGAGVTGRTHFRSVTMTESVENLQAFNDALPGAYKKVEVADAQSYVSLDFYADILTEHGDMTPEIEAAIAKAKAGETLDKAEVKLLRPYKPFYYTRVFNENTGLLESQQIKNSIIPVIKGISPEFDKFEAWMSDNSIDQVQMNSAHKVGQTRSQVDLRGEDGSFAGKKVKETEVYTLPMSGYRKQVNVTDHWHNDSTNKLASQLEKIVVAAAVRNMGQEGAQIAERFLSTMDSIYAEQMDKLFSQFEKESGLVDLDAFKEWMVGQVDDGTTPQYVLDLINKGMFTAPSVINTVRGRLFTAVERDVNTIRVAGGTQVQVASQFYRTNENRLRGMRIEDGVVKPAEIAVSRDFLPKQYREMSIAEIKAAAPEVLESITLRIPSESLNSGSVVEVVEFLPEGMDGVIVPDEFVTQMGSDFDVDKLFFQFKAGDGSKADTLFDLQVQVFKDQRNLKEIMAPQGFDTFSDASNKRPLRSAKQQEFINANPYSAVTHGFLRADNMAGVALKGQAANKNVILLDLIRYGYEFRPEKWKVNGKEAKFVASEVSNKLVMQHAEAVAAAMDGAKDPVYGKLGINNDNFGFFMEMLLLTDGDFDAAVSVIQSKPMQLLSNGDIQLTRSMDGKSNFVIPMTEKGEAFVRAINSETKFPSESPENGVGLPDNRNFFTKIDASDKGDMFTIAAIATWKNEVTSPLRFINSVMRSDKVQVAKGIEGQMLRRAPDADRNVGQFRNPLTGNITSGNEAEQLPVKNKMKQMFERTSSMLNKMGDGYLNMKQVEGGTIGGQGLTMQQYDAYGREQAAAQYARLNVYEAMGERNTKAPRELVEDRGAWSLENWLRHFRNSDEVKSNPDLALVVSKMLVSTNPYNVRGTYYDNITLVGVSDDGELKQVTDAMDRLVADNDIDILDFVESIQAYEAQRSRYQMSQGRMTRILPTATQIQIAEAAGAAGVLDNNTGVSPLLMIETDVHNPNVDFIAKTVEEGMQRADAIGKAKVYRTGDGHVVFPTGESEEGFLYWGAVLSPNAGRKFSGKHIREADILGMQGSSEDTADSRLMYTPELNADEKVQYLQERFRRVGMPVTVEFDSSLPVNGRVVFDKGTATIKLHPEMLQSDTVAHEFGHILVEALGYEHPLVQQAIGELKGSALYKMVKQSYPDLSTRDLEMEVLVTALGRRGTELFEEAKTQSRFKAIYNRIMRAIGKVFGIQPKATEQLAQELMFGDGELSLDDRIEGFQDQRRTQTATETADIAAIQLRERIAYLKKTGGTSVDAKAALARAEQTYKGVNGGLVAERLAALDQAVTDVIADAGAVSDTIDAAAKGMRNSKNLTAGEATIMRQAHNLLSELETLRKAMENMKPELMEDGAEMTEVQEAYKQLQDKYDLLLEAHSNLTGAVRDGLSNKLKAQSSNKDLMDKVGADNLFDLAQNPRLRHLMTDVDSITKGTLGIKEFQNPVTQQIAKLVADTLETARLDGKDAEAQVGKIMRDFEAQGGNIEDIIDFETGAFKGEYDSVYYQAREKARKSAMGKNKRALDIFDMENTEQQYTSEYYKNWTVRFGSIADMQEKVDRLQGLVKRMPNRTNLREELKEARKSLLIELNKSAEAFEQFHNVEVLDGFAEAFAAAEKKVEDAVAARDAGEQVKGRDFFALQDFRAMHGVIKVGGKNIPTTGQYASVSVKEEYNNEAWTGQPQPIAKWKNASFDANSLNGKTITALQAEMRKAAGAHGAEFVNNGFIPAYASIASKSAAEQAASKAKAAGKAAADAAKGMGSNEGYESEVQQDAMGGRIFIRNTALFNPATAEQLAGLKREDMAKHIKQFVKDAHIENAKRSLEPIAYLSREAFNESQIIDGQHVLKVGKKGEKMKAMKSARGSNIADALDQWFEGVLGDNWEDTTSMDQFAGVFQRYTSLMGVGLNVSAWVNNYGYGSLQRHLEFAGRDYFSKENSKRAHKLLHGALGDITRDLWSGREGEFTNKISAIVHTLDVADDQRELPFNMTEGFVDKAISKAFIGQTLGEIMMQNQPLLAMMMEQEVVLADGTRTNMLDAYELNDGVLSFPEGAKVVTAEGDVDLDNAYIARFRNKVKSINHHIHGAYNKQDAGTWQRHWIGRLAMQFRRWLPMGIKKRYGKRMFNESREREEIGDYTAALEILKIFGQDASKLGKIKEVLQGIKESDPLVYHNAMRALKEVLVSMAAFGLLAAIYAFGIDDDDELGFAAAFALNRTERIGEEMRTYTPLGMYDFFLQTKKDPIATLSKAEDAMSFLRYSVHDAGAMVFGYDIAKYESGRNSGQSKTMRAAVGTLPVLSHFRRLAELEDNTRTYSLVRGFIY